VEAREVKRPDSTVLLSPGSSTSAQTHSEVSAGLRHRRTAAAAPQEVHDFGGPRLRDCHSRPACTSTCHADERPPLSLGLPRYDIIDVEDGPPALRKTERYREARTETDSQRIVRL